MMLSATAGDAAIKIAVRRIGPALVVARLCEETGCRAVTADLAGAGTKRQQSYTRRSQRKSTGGEHTVRQQTEDGQSVCQRFRMARCLQGIARSAERNRPLRASYKAGRDAGSRLCKGAFRTVTRQSAS
jgi:hypothetical protein